MKTQQLEGWLFDADEFGTVIVLWIYDDAGKLHRLQHEFQTPVFVHGARAALIQLATDLGRRKLITGVTWKQQREFWSGAELEVMQLNVADAAYLPRLRQLAATNTGLVFYNLSLPPAQYYLCLHGLFPLCRMSCTVDEYGYVQEIQALNSAWEMEHRLPPLRVLRMRGERLQPLSAHSHLVVGIDGKETLYSFSEGARLIHRLNALMAEYDPDLLLSERGDTLIFPAMLKLARREKVALQFDRDAIRTDRKIETEGRTYFSYGKVIYKGPRYPLLGRWHIDRENSFAWHETDLEGVLELARLSKMPIQRSARRSPGTAMTGMQLDQAIQRGILIPWQKSEPERFKTALQLLQIDKGGLTFQPPIGTFAHVAEIDFASMYPSLMVTHNLSPETVLCACCQNEAVPEAGYNVCTKRRGLIPLTLEPLVARRRVLKQMMKATDDPALRAVYEARRAAIKWMLVSCFGYLGYKNAVFGRIEAHEAVTAWGRETLLRAKDIAEARGYKMLHALTDSLWLQREQMNETDLRDLCAEISQASGLEMSLEGLYHWITFLPSKVNPNRPVPARYFGLFTNGELKARGLAYRRHDTAPFIQAVQQELLELLTTAHTLDELRLRQQDAAALLELRCTELASGQVPLSQLVIQQTLSRAPEDYAVATRTALAAQELIDDGIVVHPGETVGYVITDAKAHERERRVTTSQANGKATYDVAEYERLLRAAGAEICNSLHV